MRRFTFLLILGLLSFGLISGYQYYTDGISYAKDPDSDQRVVIEIPKGSSALQIAKLLESKHLIKDSLVFRLYLKQTEQGSMLKAGRMVFRQNMNLKEVVATLIEGKSEEFAVTLLEGWTVSQMADHLESVGLTTADEFLRCLKQCEFDFEFLPKDYLEGYLYPDTYFVNFSSYTNELFIKRLIQTLENRLTFEDWSAIELSDHSFEEIMIMASIIEREERAKSERATVAGILWNRFDAGAGLGADATVLYALGRTKGGLTYNDLQVESPYNTRKYRGLPPTPIANPSVSSIKAALYPHETDYWYYLHSPDGQIHYARTLDEHNENKRKYL